MHHYSRGTEIQEHFVELGLTMLIINKTEGRVVFSQMNLIP